MKKQLLTVFVLSLATGSIASAQINQFDGALPGATSFLDFDNPFVASGPIADMNAVFSSVGIDSISLVGAWSVAGDVLSSGANVNGQVLISDGGGMMRIGAVGDPLDGPGVGAGFDIQLSGPVSEFGVNFSDQINFDYTLELRRNGGSLGTGTFRFSGSFPRDGHYWSANNGLFDRIVIRFQNGGGVGLDEIAMVSSGIGSNYCGPAEMNSTGASAAMSASGSTAVVDNDLTLIASNLPTNAFCFFIVSQTQGFVAMPGGSLGNLCVVSAVGRYVGPGQIQNSGTAGAASLAIDLTATPQPSGPVAVVPGDVYNFQLWYRDAIGGVAGSNFTDGLEITFQ